MAISIEKFLLASSSPYRRQLLQKVIGEFITVAPEVDETRAPEETPRHLAVRLAEAKVRALTSTYNDYWIIASDQVAVCGSSILGKPGDAATAVNQLEVVSGKTVNFYTAVSIFNPGCADVLTELDSCKVVFKRLREAQIKHYIAIDNPLDCAGSFKSEGFGIVLMERFIGDDPNALVGLPLIKLTQMLERMGINLL